MLRNLVQVAQTDLETFYRILKILPVFEIYKPRMRREETWENGNLVVDSPS